MEEPDEDERIPPLIELEPEAKRTAARLWLGFWLTGLIVYLVFAFLYAPWDGVLALGTLGGIVIVAVFLHRLQTLQFSLKTVLIAVITLQIPMALLLTAKSQLHRGIGIVLALLWAASFVTYVLVTAKPEKK